MTRIYLSYRPQDADVVEPLARRILQTHGLFSLFIDPARTCHPEADLETCIRDMMGIVQVVFLVVGHDWAGIDEYGRFRLSRADMPLYAEVRWALASRCEIVLVLVKGAQLPNPEVVPEDMHGIYGLRAVRLRSEAYFEDLQLLVPEPTFKNRLRYFLSFEWTRRHALRGLER